MEHRSNLDEPDAILRAFEEQNLSDPRVAVTWAATLAYKCRVNDPEEDTRKMLNLIKEMGMKAALNGDSVAKVGVAAMLVLVEDNSAMMREIEGLSAA